MSLKDKSTAQLNLYKAILEKIILENKDDSRIGEPKRQLSIINEELQSRENINIKQDKDHLVVGLKTLEIKGSSNLRG